jgi:hypothetical protein
MLVHPESIAIFLPRDDKNFLVDGKRIEGT